MTHATGMLGMGAHTTPAAKAAMWQRQVDRIADAPEYLFHHMSKAAGTTDLAKIGEHFGLDTFGAFDAAGEDATAENAAAIENKRRLKPGILAGLLQGDGNE